MPFEVIGYVSMDAFHSLWLILYSQEGATMLNVCHAEYIFKAYNFVYLFDAHSDLEYIQRCRFLQIAEKKRLILKLIKSSIFGTNQGLLREEHIKLPRLMKRSSFNRKKAL